MNIVKLEDVLQWVPQGVVILGVLGLVGWALVCRPVLGFLGAWFFIILSPTSSIIPVITETGPSGGCICRW